MTVTFQLPMHPWSAQATIHVIVEVCCETETLVRLSERVILSALEHDVVLIKRKRINTTTLGCTWPVLLTHTRKQTDTREVIAKHAPGTTQPMLPCSAADSPWPCVTGLRSVPRRLLYDGLTSTRSFVLALSDDCRVYTKCERGRHDAPLHHGSDMAQSRRGRQL